MALAQTFRNDDVERAADSFVLGKAENAHRAAVPQPDHAVGIGLERLLLAMEREGAAADPPRLDLFVAFEEPELRGRLLPQIAQWRAEGRSVDTDYAGRSMKGQLTQAQRLGAEAVVVAHSDGTYEVRRRGEEDRVVQSLSEL